MTQVAPVVFLLDVDNTLLDNDRIGDDLKRHLTQAFGAERRSGTGRYSRSCAWPSATRITSAPCSATGPSTRATRISCRSPFTCSIIRSPTACSRARLDVIEHLRTWGPTVILSDGDVVFQPRKIERSGLFEAVEGHVLIYIHKERELDDVEKHYPARHYVLVDDKPRILTAVKKVWGDTPDHRFPAPGALRPRPQIPGLVPARGHHDRAHRRPAPVRPVRSAPVRRGRKQHKPHRNLPSERNHESDPKTPRYGPEPLARQHHPRSADQRHAPPLYRGVLGHGAHLEPHDLRPRHQEQPRLRRRHPPEIEGRQVGRGAVLRAGAGGPEAGRRSVPADPRPDRRRGRLGVAGGLAPVGPRHGRHPRRGQGPPSPRRDAPISSSRYRAPRRASPPSRKPSSRACRST